MPKSCLSFSHASAPPHPSSSLQPRLCVLTAATSPHSRASLNRTSSGLLHLFIPATPLALDRTCSGLSRLFALHIACSSQSRSTSRQIAPVPAHLIQPPHGSLPSRALHHHSTASFLQPKTHPLSLPNQ